jgi:hypothetical protein
MARHRNRAVDATMPLPGIPRPVGRPRKADALTGAQRQKLWRQRHKAAGISVMRNGNSKLVEGDLYVCQFCGRFCDIDPADQECPADYCEHLGAIDSGSLCNTRSLCNGLHK